MSTRGSTRTILLGLFIGGWVAAIATASLSQSALALDANTTDPRAIMRAALEAQTPAQRASRMKMSIKDRSGTRERLLNVWMKRFDDARKTLILIEQPADVRNTGFLSIDYRAPSKTDEQWLYLPKLHRVTRVPASGKANSFVGSDFSLFDLSQQDPDGYDAKMIDANGKVGNEPCWIIEGTPRSATLKEESGYEKTQFWVSKKTLVMLQLKATLVGGKRVKYYKASDIRKVDGTWTPHHMQMRTLDGSNVVSETLVDVVAADASAANLTEADFTQQRLERGI